MKQKPYTRETIRIEDTPAPMARALQAGTTVADRYLIERLIGQGGFGAVYQAVDTRLGSVCALKIAFGNQGSQFKREAELLARLQHPALPKVFDFFESEYGDAIAMDYIDGIDLEQHLARQGPVPLDQARRWCSELVDVLDHLHRHGIIHRDIKPANIKLNARGRLMLVDLGIAKTTRTGGATIALKSQAGFTMTYAPLEQIRADKTDARADIYALAATLFHLLSGQVPPSALDRAAAMALEHPDPLIAAMRPIQRQHGESVATALLTAMALDAQYRYPSAQAFRTAFLALPKPKAEKEAPARESVRATTLALRLGLVCMILSFPLQSLLSEVQREASAHPELSERAIISILQTGCGILMFFQVVFLALFVVGYFMRSIFPDI